MIEEEKIVDRYLPFLHLLHLIVLLLNHFLQIIELSALVELLQRILFERFLLDLDLAHLLLKYDSTFSIEGCLLDL